MVGSLPLSLPILFLETVSLTGLELASPRVLPSKDYRCILPSLALVCVGSGAWNLGHPPYISSNVLNEPFSYSL